jgi:Zn-dependent protease
VRHSPAERTPSRDGLVSVRAAVVLLTAIIVGCAAGALAHLAGQPTAAALLVAGGAFGATLGLANSLIQDR